ncbi:hypothetical protein H7F51_11300 [Novosphingobium flavum]|uniref:Alpha/beta hydrolase n=1 Tax=Novosphingobium flavum TaxID=1778672 RepID=A0A7X1KM83_9SPHN|nr:hypothetical protein [Novosphingobium flavum]MBC2666103.1 hypothetical protein [Novosphingobium flavum]
MRPATTLTGLASIAAAMAMPAAASGQQGAPSPIAPPQTVAGGPVATDAFRVSFVRLGSQSSNALLYEPVGRAADPRVLLVYTYPRARYDASPAEGLAARGYRVLMVRNYLGSRRGEVESPLDGIAGTSLAIKFGRTLPGVEKVVVMGWGTGARMAAFYAGAAERGPAVCQRPELLYKCDAQTVTGLAKTDGVILFDPGLGAPTKAYNVDPAYSDGPAGARRDRAALDMYAPANGYDPKTGLAAYSPAFRQRYFAAQGARNNALIDRALARLAALNAGKGNLADDEPFTVAGAFNVRSPASLHRNDLSLLSRTKKPYLLLKADGTSSTQMIRSIRPATGLQDVKVVGACCENGNYGVRRFLANDAVRTAPDYALTEDDVKGVDWATSATSTPTAAEGIVVPTLIMTTTCFQFVVPSEIVLDHIPAKDKTLVAVEGSEHFFRACKPEYGDTKKRNFDFVASWLAQPGRF